MIDKRVHIDVDKAGKITLSGNIIDFMDHDMAGGPDNGGWTERIQRGAFVDTLANHRVSRLVIDLGDKWVIQLPETAMLSLGEHALTVRATLPPRACRPEMVRQRRMGIQLQSQRRPLVTDASPTHYQTRFVRHHHHQHPHAADKRSQR